MKYSAAKRISIAREMKHSSSRDASRLQSCEKGQKAENLIC